MATTTFGAPMDDTQEVTQASAGAENQVAETLDINDPRFTSEALDVNPEGDAYAMPPPPPDGRYRAKLKPLKVKDAAGTEHDYIPKASKNGQAYLQSAMIATILDNSGKHDGVQVYDRWVGTFVNDRDKSSKIQTTLAKLKRPDGKPWVTPGERLTHKAWVDRYLQALAGEPEVGIETRWEWSCQGCGEEAKKKGADYPKSVMGMRNFPSDGKGGFIPERMCQVNPSHGTSRAQVRIDRIMMAGEVK